MRIFEPARLRLGILALAPLAVVGCAGPRVGRTVDARVPRTTETTITDVRTAGPFYERVETSAGDTRLSLRPCLYTKIDVPQDNASVRDVFWPLYADHSRKESFSWRFLQTFGADVDTLDPESPFHVWSFPFWFHGRDRLGQDYAALFPVGGVLRDFLSFDEIRFAAFPLWMETRRHGVDGQNFLWPIFAWAKGNGQHRWRVFPLVGHSRKDGDWDRHFVLWPLWNSARYDSGPLAGYEWALVPVFGRAERGLESSWYVLPPFLQFTYGRGRNEGQRRILAPWPFVRIEDSRNEHKRHFWPLYASTWSDRSRRTNILWPFYQHTRATYGDTEVQAWSLAPLFHRAVERKITPADGPLGNRQQSSTAANDSLPAPPVVAGTGHTVTALSYTRLWPLFSRIEHEGRSFVRVPDFSLHRRTGPLERNLLHMGTLYTRGAESAPRLVEHELLWGLVRWSHAADGCREIRLWPLFSRSRDRAANRSAWSLLGGLLGLEETDGATQRRFFWFFTRPSPD